MAISVNRLTIVGNVGAEPVRKGSGDGFVTMSVATSKNWKDRDTGEKREKTQWHSVVIFNKAAANYAEQYIKKGDLVYVEGSLESRDFQGNDGTNVRLYELVVSPFEGVVQSVSRNSDGRRERTEEREEQQRNDSQNRWQENRNYGSGAGSLARDMDDDIPFMYEWR